MISPSLKAKALVLSIFLVGVAMGVFVANFYESRVRGEEIGSANPTDNARPAGAGQTSQEQEDSNGARDSRERRRSSIAREVDRFQDYLELTEQQRMQIETILEQTRSEFRTLSTSTRAQYDVIRERSRDQIRSILTSDEQRQKYEELVERFNRRRRRGRN